MSDLVDPDVEEYAFESTRPEPAHLRELAERTREGTECPQMLTGRVEGRFLKMIVRLTAPRLVVDVGTFTGYSALSMAEGLPEGGRVVTCEVDPRAARMARAAFDASPWGDRIELRIGPALATIRELDAIGLAFIDADKTGYPDYYEAVLERLRPGGVILLDNMLLGGRVLSPDAEDDGARTLARLNEAIRDDPRVENVFLTVRDGIQLVRKL